MKNEITLKILEFTSVKSKRKWMHLNILRRTVIEKKIRHMQLSARDDRIEREKKIYTPKNITKLEQTISFSYHMITVRAITLCIHRTSKILFLC